MDADSPMVVCVKAVPTATPNASGRWMKVVAEPRHLNPRKHGEDRRLTMWDALAELLPAGHSAVAVSDNLFLDGKSGDYAYWGAHPKLDPARRPQ